MHLVNITPHGVEKMRGSIPWITEGRYLVCDANVGELFVTGMAERAEYYHIDCPLHWGSLQWRVRKMLIIPHGGFGDMLFLTPSLFWIHEKHHEIEISLCAFDNYLAILDSPGLEFVKRVGYPLLASEIDAYDVIVPLEECIKPGLDAVTAIAERMCAEPVNKKPHYIITDEEKVGAEYRFPKTNKKRIGLQLKSTSAARSWPQRYCINFTGLCLQEGYEVFLFGAPGEAQGVVPHGVVNLTACDPPLSFRESAAVVSSLDCMVAPDSAFCHIAGCLDIPTVALYAAFPWNERVGHFTSVRALTGKASCGIQHCHWHAIAGQQFPPGERCEYEGECSGMVDLSPERVLRAVKQRLQ